MGDQTMRQAPPVRKSRPASRCRMLFRVIDRLSQWMEVENYAVAPHRSLNHTALAAGPIRGINRKALTSGHICM
jgi:hypothetical protein